MSVSKTDALPLGDTPFNQKEIKFLFESNPGLDLESENSSNSR